MPETLETGEAPPSTPIAASNATPATPGEGVGEPAPSSTATSPTAASEPVVDSTVNPSQPEPAAPSASPPAGSGSVVHAPPQFEIPLELGRVAQDLQIRKQQVEQIAELLDQGFDVPFLVRYRKERLGGLSEEQVRQIKKRLILQKQMIDRKQAILRNLQTQGKLGDALRDAIVHAETNRRLEDLYLPYKPRKKSNAASAREKGLEPFAQSLFAQDAAVANVEELWPTFVNPEKGLATVDEVKTNVKLLLAEMLAEQAAVRDAARRFLWEQAKLSVTRHPGLAEGQGQEFKDYFQFSDGLRHLAAHRVSAINRGEKAHALEAKLSYSGQKLLDLVTEKLALDGHAHAEILREAIPQAVEQFLAPALEREARRELTEKAEEHAAQVIAKNLKRLLLQPPLPATRVLAIDPGFRSGCWVAALDEAGNLLEHAVIHPHPTPDKGHGKKGKSAEPAAEAAPETESAATKSPEAASSDTTAETPAGGVQPSVAEPTTESPTEPQATETAPPDSPAPVSPEQRRHAAKEVLEGLLRKHEIQIVALGNGAASRETEELLGELIAERLPELSYHLVPEHGATHYSMSPLGREELPNVDPPVRAAISLGRRLQDPLREMAKIDPLQLGLGFFHQDVPEKRLRELLADVVESAVNEVGLDVNSAAVPQLRLIAGLNPLRASNLVQHRQAQGLFKSREDLKQVAGMTDLAWQQSAGFLRITDAANPLDRTWLHPEHYETAAKLLESLGSSTNALLDEAQLEPLRQKFAELDLAAESAKYQLSPDGLDDILRVLARPGKDPRSDQPAPIFKKKQLRVEDLQPGMELRGTVLNVVDFGAFVDVGLKDNGLVHISQLANRFVKSPYDLVFVGDVVTVWVLTVDAEKNRVSLTMIPPGTERPGPERRQGAPRGERTPRRSEGERPPKRERRFPAQVATPDHPSGPLPRLDEGRSAGNRPPPRQFSAPPPRPPQPKRDRPLPKLSQEALKGKTALRTFGELKALYAAKKPEDEKKPEEHPPAPPEAVLPSAPAVTAPTVPEPATPATEQPTEPQPPMQQQEEKPAREQPGES